MLDSIKKSLKANGVLYILESTVELNKNDEDSCEDALQKKEIVDIIVNNGFILTKEIILGESVLLKFEIR
ncbi:MAG: hypothetical protein ACI8RP_001090 [Urechidicola sp.]|jgi:hypothetical protein